MPHKLNIRSIAIYLPQYHPIPENDRWWGQGFTEWTNVTKAKPLFENHYQPHLPADLGFYDLRISEVRETQAKIAGDYGIYGFCYYHYWFNGKRVLERPFQEVFDSGKPDFPFMLCWANENWTRSWDGKDKDVLLHQSYSPEDDRLHINELIPYFKDSRYIKVDGKPVFAVYKSTAFPNMKETIRIWRDEAKKEGLELYLCRFESMAHEGKAYLEAGFDAAVEFQPQIKIASVLGNEGIKTLKDEFSFSNLKNSFRYRWHRLLGKSFELDPYAQLNGSVVSYSAHASAAVKRYNKSDEYKRYRCVMPGWDNSARRNSDFLIYHGSTPELFGAWVKNSISSFQPYSKEENLFFINAWNEWAEGNHLEPCQRWGRAYLEALHKNLN